MRYSIRHETRFVYDAPVRFARCNIRLQPILWSGQVLVAHSLTTQPPGQFSAARADKSLANVTRFAIDDPVNELTILSTATVDVDRPIPLPRDDDPDLASVARWARESYDAGPTSPANYLFPTATVTLDPAIAAWCAESLNPKRGCLEAVLDLACRIQREFVFDPDATQTETLPAEAFAQRRGVCQDFAQIMISGLRSAGLPAAYVSGYLRTIPPPGEARLIGADATHAWVLLWCGSALGWVGVDPTNGIWMAGDHIVTAIGRDYADVAPIDGVFFGVGPQRIHVAVDVVPEAENIAYLHGTS